MMPVVLDHTEQVAANIITFWFKPDRQLRYKAGQFIKLEVPHENPDSRGIRRWFTLSSSPTEPLVAITTKFIENGSSFKRALRALQPGTQVGMAPPAGDFVLPANKETPLVFVGGGIGVTPLRSMVKWLTDTNERRDIHLIYALSYENELAFEPLFRAYGLRFDPVVSNPSADWQGLTGRLDGGRIIELAGPLSGKLVYLSGPEPMIEALADGLKSQNVPPSSVITDFFPGYTHF